MKSPRRGVLAAVLLCAASMVAGTTLRHSQSAEASLEPSREKLGEMAQQLAQLAERSDSATMRTTAAELLHKVLGGRAQHDSSGARARTSVAAAALTRRGAASRSGIPLGLIFAAYGSGDEELPPGLADEARDFQRLFKTMAELGRFADMAKTGQARGARSQRAAAH